MLFNNWTKQSIHKTLLITKTVYETEIEQWLVHGIFRGQINDVLFLGDISFAQFMSSFGLSAGQCIALETCLNTSFHLMLYCSPAACKKWWTPPALFAFPLIVCTSSACAESLLLPQFQRHIKKSEGQKTPKVELQISIYGVKILDPKTKVGFLKYKNILCSVAERALAIKIKPHSWCDFMHGSPNLDSKSHSNLFSSINYSTAILTPALTEQWNAI